MDDWDSSCDAERKREVVRRSAEIHRRKGTVAAVKTALKAAGYGDAELVERWSPNVLSDDLLIDGSWQLAAGDHWAEYRVILDQPITVAQAAHVRAILGSVSPARSHLKVLDFTSTRFVLADDLLIDGTWTLGEA